MFNTKASSKDTPPAGTTIIGAGTTINGDIQSNGDIRVDGILVGNLTAGANNRFRRRSRRQSGCTAGG